MNPFATELRSMIWAMEPKALERLIVSVGAIPDAAIAEAVRMRVDAGTAEAFANLQTGIDSATPLDVRDGVAHINVAGPLMKNVPSAFKMFGIDATSTTDLRDQITRAVEDPSVNAIQLNVESPGGSIDGLDALAADVAAASSLKPTSAHTNDLMASAAYWLASQSNKITAGPTAAVGSIGVYSVVEDTSQAAAKSGVVVNVISSHPLKGAGVDGSQFTEAQKADAQRVIDQYASLFVDAVAAGRGIDRSKAQESATGQVWIGQELVDRGLVDAITRSDKPASNQPSAIQAQENEARPVSESQKGEIMDPKIEKPVADSSALEAKCSALEAQLAAINAKRRDEVLAKHADKVEPAAMEQMRAFGSTFGEHVDQFDAFLAKLPKAVRDARVSEDIKSEQVEAKMSGIEAQIGGEAGAKQVASWLESSVAKLNAYAHVKGAFSNGTFLLDDGRVVTKEELNKMVAA